MNHCVYGLFLGRDLSDQLLRELASLSLSFVVDAPTALPVQENPTWQLVRLSREVFLLLWYAFGVSVHTTV